MGHVTLTTLCVCRLSRKDGNEGSLVPGAIACGDRRVILQVDRTLGARRVDRGSDNSGPASVGRRGASWGARCLRWEVTRKPVGWRCPKVIPRGSSHYKSRVSPGAAGGGVPGMRRHYVRRLRRRA